MNDAQSAESRMSAASFFGGVDAPDPVKCSTIAIEALLAVVGAGAKLTSIQLDVSSKPISGNEVTLRARIDKRTRSIAFASLEGVAGDEMVFRARGLFGLKAVG